MSRVTSRRTVVRGAAWTVPALSVAGASPAFAGTTQTPTVEGLTELSRSNMAQGSQCTMSIGGSGASTYPTSRTWVTGAKSATSMGTLSMTFWFPGTWSGATITNTASAGWSSLVANPTAVRPASVPTGYVAYSMSYSGTWLATSTAGVYVTATRPRVTLVRAGACLAGSNVTFHVERRTTVNGTAVYDINTRTFNSV